MTPSIEDSIIFAANAHRGQIDKGGEPYIFHPIRVMLAQSNDHDRTVAILHDVIEDCKVTTGELKDLGYSSDVINDIVSVTRVRGENYADFIGRIARGSLSAIQVKLDDILDNTSIKRSKRTGYSADKETLLKYYDAEAYLADARNLKLNVQVSKTTWVCLN